MALSFQHGVCAISQENPAFLTTFCRNDRGIQWVPQNDPLRVDFDRHIKLEFPRSTATSDAGLKGKSVKLFLRVGQLNT